MNKKFYVDILFMVISLSLGVIVVLFTVVLFDMGSITFKKDLFSGLMAITTLFLTTYLIVFSLSRYLKDGKTVKKPTVVVDETTKSEKQTESDSKEKKENQGYAYDDLLSLKRRDVLNIFKSTEDRLMNEISSLKRWSRINLIIGVLITVAGLGTLFAFIYLGKEDFNRVLDKIYLARLTLYWVSKLSLVIIIEIFAYFFLKMYKENMETIKYYHNELTSIESRKKALLFSILHGCKEDVSHTIDTMNSIDRNFILQKEQTTVELERVRMTNASMKEQIDNMWGLLKNIIPIKNANK